MSLTYEVKFVILFLLTCSKRGRKKTKKKIIQCSSQLNWNRTEIVYRNHKVERWNRNQLGVRVDHEKTNWVWVKHWNFLCALKYWKGFINMKYSFWFFCWRWFWWDCKLLLKFWLLHFNCYLVFICLSYAMEGFSSSRTRLKILRFAEIC